MNLLALTTEQMAAISADWLNNQKKLLLEIPYTACYVEDLAQVYRSILTFLPKPLIVPIDIQNLTEKATGLDRRHDRLYRGSMKTFDAQAYFAETEEEESLFETMKGHYFPRGEGGTTLTYQEESGGALILYEKLISTEAPNVEYRNKLKQVTVHGNKSLFDKLTELASVGKELGEVDKAKAQALKAQEEASRAGSSDSARKLQFEWIDVVKLLLNGLEHAQKKGILTEEAQQSLYGPLEKAQEAIQKRNAAKRSQKTPQVIPGASVENRSSDASVIPPGATPETTEEK